VPPPSCACESFFFISLLNDQEIAGGKSACKADPLFIYIANTNRYLYSEYGRILPRRAEGCPVPANHNHWLTAQQAALELDSTSAEICRLISIGRLSGSKEKQPGRPGKAQWLVSPASVRKELRFRAKLRANQKRRDKCPAVTRQSKIVVSSVSVRQDQSASAV
jgi:hypothetical protein